MKKAFILPLLIVMFMNISEASKHTFVQKLRYSSYKSYTRVVVDLDGPVDFTEQRITNPDRLFFDLKKCALTDMVKDIVPIHNGILKTVRFAQFNRDTVRVVLDLESLRKYSAFLLEEPSRLVIDVYPGDEAAVPGKDEKAYRKIHTEKPPERIKTIMLDPGHGGKDPGAIGPRGLKEKDITLYVGKRLGQILKEKNGVEIIYTRDRDVYVPLNDRTELANSRKADLFISIHTNASEKRNTRGIETYFLNWTNNREALRVAARENRISINKMEKIQDGLQMILQDLARNNKREESMRLAHSVQNSMVNSLSKNYPRIENLGVKYALFYVLVGAEMPSILVEISFISNRDEEVRLSKKNYRNEIAEAIARGISSYISESTLIVDNSGTGTPEG